MVRAYQLESVEKGEYLQVYLQCTLECTISSLYMYMYLHSSPHSLLYMYSFLKSKLTFHSETRPCFILNIQIATCYGD